ncbi:hypothetical protein [Streptomyces sp. 184]|uniref:hypothetical protein n=1 Tax=Streptomyces sp. 184 TaxID=1827526 RepID=UPI00389284FC
MSMDQWSFLVAILALLVAAWAIKYARSQAKSAEAQLEVARRVHREQNEPYVIVDIRPDEPGSFALALVIENVGPTMARNVKINTTPSLTSSLGEDVSLALQRVLSQTIPMIPPGRRLVYLFDIGKRFDSGLPMAFEFIVRSEGPMGPVEELRYTVDLGVLSEALIGRRPTKGMEKHLDKIGKSLKEFTRHFMEANDQAIAATHTRRFEAYQRRLSEAQPQGSDEEAGSTASSWD